jgi:hypothetical protein
MAPHNVAASTKGDHDKAAGRDIGLSVLKPAHFFMTWFMTRFMTCSAS